MKLDFIYRPGRGLVEGDAAKKSTRGAAPVSAPAATKSVTVGVTPVTCAVTRVTEKVTALVVPKIETPLGEPCPVCGHVPALTKAQKQAAYRARKKAVS